MSSINEIADLASGQSRWIGRHDIHVVCHNPCEAYDRGDGKVAYRRVEASARYRVAATDVDWTEWLPLERAAEVVDSILAGGEPADW